MTLIASRRYLHARIKVQSHIQRGSNILARMAGHLCFGLWMSMTRTRHASISQPYSNTGLTSIECLPYVASQQPISRIACGDISASITD
jgi:hypothetical protein